MMMGKVTGFARAEAATEHLSNPFLSVTGAIKHIISSSIK
jgi:hypothetical protein